MERFLQNVWPKTGFKQINDEASIKWIIRLAAFELTVVDLPLFSDLNLQSINPLVSSLLFSIKIVIEPPGEVWCQKL